MYWCNGKGTVVFTRLLRLLFILIIGGLLIWFLAPRIFDNAANSLISSTSSQAQGLAQFVPAGVSSPNKGDLQINLTGLTADTTYQLTMDQAQCSGTGTNLGQARSNSSGNLYLELPLTSLDISKIWYVDILQGSQSVACGLLQTNQDTGIQFIDASQSGPDIFGSQGTPVAQPTPTPTAQNQAGATPTDNSNASNKPSGLPNTGADPGGNQRYDNNQYPRKY